MSINLLIKFNKNKVIFADSETDECLYDTEDVKIGKDDIGRIRRSPPQGNLENFAEVQFRTSTHPTRLVYKGKTVSLDEFCKEMDGKRMFIASDGKQYGWDPEEFAKGKWRVGIWDVASTSEDPELVAKTHKRHYGIFHKAQKYSLEILPPGRPIQDDIIVAYFVACVLLRNKNAEDRAKARAEMRSDAIGNLITSSIGFAFKIIFNN